MLGQDERYWKYLLLEEEDIVEEGDEWYSPKDNAWYKVDSNPCDEEDKFVGTNYNSQEMKPIRRENPDYIYKN